MKTRIQTASLILLLLLVFTSNGQQSLFENDSEKDKTESKKSTNSLFSEDAKSSQFDEEKGNPKKGRFSGINLKELRRTVLTQMLKDGLIKNKRETVYLFLRADGITFNDQKLSSELDSKYQQLLSPFNIGTGPHRTLLFNDECTAVGDFTENRFHGKMQGRLRTEDAGRPF